MLLATGQGATSFNDGSVRLLGSPVARIWDVSVGLEVAQPMEHRLGIQGLTFNSNGNQLATSDEDNAVRIWSLTGRLLKVVHKPSTFAAHEPISDVIFVDGGFRILYNRNEHWAEIDGEDVRLYDVTVDTYSNDEPKDIVTLIKESNSSLAVMSPDGARIVVGGKNGIAIHGMDGSRKQVSLMEQVQKVAFSPDGELIATYGVNGSNTTVVDLPWPSVGSCSGRTWQCFDVRAAIPTISDNVCSNSVG
jgi:WD40 repeat protein